MLLTIHMQWMTEPAGVLRRARRLLAHALPSFFLLAALLSAVCGPVWAQDDEAGRDAWQQPDRVMDALGIAAGTQVADVGCGDGYFVLRLARRVGQEGRVYGVDIDSGALRKLRRRVNAEGLTNVEIVKSGDDDTRLPPASVDVVLVVNAYHEMRKFDAMLRSIRQALKPGGLLAILDAPGSAERDRDAHRRSHTIAESIVQEDAERNGFRFLRREPGFERTESHRREWFFLIFQKAAD